MANTQLIFPDGLKVDDASGQSSLNYYQEYTIASAAVTGTSAVTGTGATVNISLARVGKIVTCRITLTTGTSPGSTNPGTTAVGTIPDWAKPTTGNVYIVTPFDFTNARYTFIRVGADGALQLDCRTITSATQARAAFDASSTLLPTCGSWPVD